MWLIHCGDLVENGDLETAWRTFFNIEDTLLETKQFLPTLGNHESPFWPYDTIFSLPDSEEYYSVDYGNLHIVVLNTETDLVGPQLAWLRQDLERARSRGRIDWIVVAFHRPPYSSGSHGSQLDVREAWCDLFETYRVDLVFAGHDHNYERTWPINGVTYVVTGGGGAPLRGTGISPWTAYAESTYHFCHVEIKGRCLKMRAVKPEGIVFDSVIIEKGRLVPEENRMKLRSMLQTSPNPMRERLVIKYILEQPQRIELCISDCLGREIAVLKCIDEPAGQQTMTWDGVDRHGDKVASGVYFVRLNVDGLKQTHKLVIAE